MMPDNKEASDNAAEDAVEDAQVESAENASTESSDTDQSAAGTVADDMPEDQLAAARAKAHGDDNDPLEFGDKRMGDDVEEIDELEALRTQLAEAEAKAAEHWDRLLRLQAEMENQRKRAQNDVSKARKFALEGIVGDLLPVKDSLEMGLAAAQAPEADSKSIIEGADLTVKMLTQVFEKNNILEVNPVDEKFDPEFHQAMSMQEVEGVPSNTVTGVMQKGYTLNERLVRPALVMVAK